LRVDVLFPINAGHFTYSVPEELRKDVKIGARVKAPFKGSVKVGIVTGINGSSKGMRLRPLMDVIDGQSLVTDGLLMLIKWISHYYMSSPGLALKNIVPLILLSMKRPGRPRIVYEKEINRAKAIRLNRHQEKALDEINKAGEGVFLLHGVTGSGKTEVYIQAIKSLPENREAIVLVPEIAITAQMIDRFRSHFGDDVVFFHSGLSDGERLRHWWSMRRGEVKVVLGVRSAVFAPFQNLGLIIVDEEHESSYKQFEGLRYNARDVAIARAEIEGIKVILGSATPSLETYYNAMKGRFHYLELPRRVDNRPLPHVEIIDMTKEPKKTWIFSEKLIEALKENNLRGHQSLLLLNRRGYSPYLICTDCGYTYKCNICSITLTYHKDTKTLKCHYCGSYKYPDSTCPECKGVRMKYAGIGTQRLEEELVRLIPEFRLRRMDRDTTAKKLSHYRMIKEMENRKIDVLLGTQMVAKGHDLPHVTLAGIVSADIAMNIPDFRSAERAFQLFTQLAGRAGRGEVPGNVYIQTYESGHYVFEFVRRNDYRGFFEKELSLREDLNYPPFSRLIRIIINFKDKNGINSTIHGLSERVKSMDTDGVDILGPSSAPIERIRNVYRWHLILKGKDSLLLRQKASVILDYLDKIKGIRVDIDIDPVNLL
jgi:primosomal protein N' (replication factor Y)